MDLSAAREMFEDSTDFTVGIEEEFALVDPGNLELVHRYEELAERCRRDPVLEDSVRGELIASEIEIRSGRGEDLSHAVELQADRRRRLFACAAELGIGLASMGTHPWADYRDQQIIDTPHYRRLQRDLGWVAQRNNTWSLHVHMGIRGADRAIAVCDHLRGLLPLLLAASANSPFLDGADSGLHSVRTEIFTRTFPRCGIPDPFGDWGTYADFIDLLHRTGSVVESTQLWWSVRPHHAFGTVEVRICDAQTSGVDATALTGLISAAIAQSALDYDEGTLPEPLLDRQIEENLWRAIRYGLDGRMIDFEAGEEVQTRAALEGLIGWAAPAAEALGVELELPTGSAGWARSELAEGRSIPEIYAEALRVTRQTYAPEAGDPA